MKEALETLTAGGEHHAPAASGLPREREPSPMPLECEHVVREHAGLESTADVWQRDVLESEESDRTEGVFANRAETREDDEARQEEPKVPQLSVSPEIVKKLAIVSGVSFGLLGLSCWLGDLGSRMILFFPLYALCVVQCALRLRNRYVNAFFLLTLVLYLSRSFLFAFEFFDYHLYIMTCGLFALEAARAPKGRHYGYLLCGVLAACAFASGILTVRSIRGIYEGAYHTYVAGSVAVPFLMLSIAGAGFLLVKNENAPVADRAATCMIALQFFPVVAFALHAANVFHGVPVEGGIDTLSYIARANFFNFFNVLPALPLRRLDWRLITLAIQCFAFAPFFALALAQMTPNVFARVFDKENRKKRLLEVAVFLALIAILTKAASLIPGVLPML
jgi:hypothetical protein